MTATASRNGHATPADVKAHVFWGDAIARLGGVDPAILDGRHHPCPRCGGKDRFRAFDDFAETGGVICGQCHDTDNADGYATLMWLRGEDFAAVHRLLCDDCGLTPGPATPQAKRPTGPTSAAKPAAAKKPEPADQGKAAREIKQQQKKLIATWNDGIPSHERISEYLRDRGITIDPPLSMRLAQEGYYERGGDGKSGKVGDFPCIVVQVQRPNGALVALHRTYLAADRPGKAGVFEPKKLTKAMYKGAVTGAAVRLYPAVVGKPLAIAEGVETAMAVHQATGLPVWAGVTGHGLEHVELPPYIATIYIFADNDPHGDGQKKAYAAAERLTNEGRTVYVVLPATAGEDWNDILAGQGEQAIRDAMAAAVKHEAKPVERPKENSLHVGQYVQPADRSNWGEIVSIDGDTIRLHFVSKEGIHREKDFQRSEIHDPLADYKSVKPSFKFDLIPSSTFAAQQYVTDWLVDNFLALGELAVGGGPPKSLKTGTWLEIAISLGTGTMVLGKFPVRKKRRVLFFSAESGARVLQEGAKRVARHKGFLLSDALVFWAFYVPKLSSAENLAALVAAIKEYGAELVIVDPLYLALLAGDTTGINAGNLYQMGPLLSPLGEICQEHKVTIAVLHHFRKAATNAKDKYELPSLESLSFSGVVEFMRQWVLLSRRCEYQPGSGLHELYMVVGGSAGHSSSWCLDVNEGQLDDDFSGRIWQPTLKPINEARRDAKDAREQTKQAQSEAKHQEQRERLLEALARFPDGETRTALADAAGIPRGATIGRHLSDLLLAGTIEPTVVQKHTRPEEGFRLAQPKAEPTNHEEVPAIQGELI